jgi:hypothetical protein|tara:strand:+ start:1331 stop:1609 length:279 start_codon:yes stop_codon:yes gene_type:complete
MKKLTDAELKSIQDKQADFNKAKIQIADGVLMQYQLCKDIDAIKSEFGVIEKELIEKYGQDSSINMQTGEVKSAEEVATEKTEDPKPLEKVE